MQRLIDDFLEHVELERNLAATTVTAYRGDLDRFTAFLSDYLNTASPRRCVPGTSSRTRCAPSSPR